ncbi:hypothetical protein CVT26_002503 [Gymnopilus dilepis]|uniref:Uncharacterized protein n=1 Tax=Gymnopilus dilepis TaxID=231916 RepID=A0A409Y3M5_9AGAR|nr:hypothetical protein CVT26_002503 [Gymnopilus dilepis]
MFPIRVLLTLSTILVSSLFASAAPMPAVHANEVHAGTVFRAHPVNFEPGHPDNSRHGGGTAHPVIAVGPANQHGFVPVVSVSHDHPPHMQSNLHNAQAYDHRFQPDSHIAVGNPVHVHIDDLHRVGHNSHLPQQLHPQMAHHLVSSVYGHHYANQVVPHAAHAAQQLNHEHQETSHAQGQHAWNIYQGAHDAASAARRGHGGH